MQEVAALIDDDELNLVFNEVTDLKYRLGLESTSLVQIDWGSFGSLLTGQALRYDGPELLW